MAYSASALAFLAARGISPAVAARAGVREKSFLTFPYPGGRDPRYERPRAIEGGPGSKVIHPRGEPLLVWWPFGRPTSAPLVLVTEGETDALAGLTALWESGAADSAAVTVAATQGTDFSVDLLAAELADVGARHVALAFDMDYSGRRFADRAQALLWWSGIQAYLVPLPPGTDLAENLAERTDGHRWLVGRLVAAGFPLSPAGVPGAGTAGMAQHTQGGEMTEEDQAGGQGQDVAEGRNEPAGGAGADRPPPADAGGGDRMPAGPGGHGWAGNNFGDDYVYALGRIEPRFPNLGIEKEFAQAMGRAATDGMTDRQALHSVLPARQNAYLARQLCWVFTVEATDAYVMRPRDAWDLGGLVESVRPAPRATDVDVLVGVRGPMAPQDACGGLVVPIVLVDQLFSFTIDELLGSLRADEGSDTVSAEAMEELFMRILQVADNAGNADHHRAVNYLAIRYEAIYALCTDAFRDDQSLAAIDTRWSRLSGTRRIVDVIFSFRSRRTDVVEKWFTRVDVTDEFPFLVTKLSRYFDR